MSKTYHLQMGEFVLGTLADLQQRFSYDYLFMPV
jgi:hypothetical protein